MARDFPYQRRCKLGAIVCAVLFVGFSASLVNPFIPMVIVAFLGCVLAWIGWDL